METSKHTTEMDLKSSQSAVEDSEEEENEVLEESPCGRWHKRREEVEQNNIPGIDATYLAMDTEEGVEVVWNEVRFSERKYFKAKEEIINDVFDRLIQMDHPNIVKLHKYWISKDGADIPKVVFITEYMSSGSLRQYFEKTKRHIKISLLVWRRWCTQTLSALCYLHSSQPSIVHGNINCDTIFISYNGLIKIGAIAPDAIHRHVKTVRGDAKSNLHFIAPELVNVQDCSALSPAVDIYSFGMCALEMAALELPTDDDSIHHITEDVIQRTINSLDNSLQKDFIEQCLRKDPISRPTARDLLFHPIIFEVPSLKLFCAHSILNNPSLQPEPLTDEAISRFLCRQNQNIDRVVAEIKQNQAVLVFKQSDFQNRELEKLLDEVKNGAYPLTAVVPTTRPPLVSRQRTISPEVVDEAHPHKLTNTTDNPYDEETRRIVYINCSIQPLAADESCYDVKIVIKLDDKINRQLTCEISREYLVPSTISQELVYYGFINKDDKDNVAQIISDTLSECFRIQNYTNASDNLTINPVAFCEKSLQVQKVVTPVGTSYHPIITTTTNDMTTIPCIVNQQHNVMSQVNNMNMETEQQHPVDVEMINLEHQNMQQQPIIIDDTNRSAHQQQQVKNLNHHHHQQQQQSMNHIQDLHSEQIESSTNYENYHHSQNV